MATKVLIYAPLLPIIVPFPPSRMPASIENSMKVFVCLLFSCSVQSISSPGTSVMHGWTYLIQNHHYACIPIQMDSCEMFTQRTASL